jgi:hypothetical protein
MPTHGARGRYLATQNNDGRHTDDTCAGLNRCHGDQAKHWPKEGGCNRLTRAPDQLLPHKQYSCSHLWAPFRRSSLSPLRAEVPGVSLGSRRQQTDVRFRNWTYRKTPGMKHSSAHCSHSSLMKNQTKVNNLQIGTGLPDYRHGNNGGQRGPAPRDSFHFTGIFRLPPGLGRNGIGIHEVEEARGTMPSPGLSVSPNSLTVPALAAASVQAVVRSLPPSRLAAPIRSLARATPMRVPLSPSKSSRRTVRAGADGGDERDAC